MAFIYKCPFCQNEYQLRTAITVTQRKCSVCKNPIDASEAQRQENYYFKQIDEQRNMSLFYSGIKWLFILAIPFACCFPFMSKPTPINNLPTIPIQAQPEPEPEPNMAANPPKELKNEIIDQKHVQPVLNKNDAAILEAREIVVNIGKLDVFLKSPIVSGKPTDLQFVALGGIKGGIKELDNIAPRLSGKFAQDTLAIRNHYEKKYLPLFDLYLSKPKTIPEKNMEPEKSKPSIEVDSMKKIAVIDEKKKAHDEYMVILEKLASLESTFKKAISSDDPEKPSPNQTAARNGIKRGLVDLAKLTPKLSPEDVATIPNLKTKYETLLKQ